MKAIEKFVSKNISTGFAHKRSNFRYSPVFLVVASLCGHLAANAQQLSLEQEPPVAVSRQPAPNLIISLDDSGSMTEDDKKKIREALKSLIGDETLFPDSSIRLGYNSMNKHPNFGYGSCTNYDSCNNAIRVLDKDHRDRFITWLDSYGTTNATPSHQTLWNIGKYLSDPWTTSNKQTNPWSANPGSQNPADNDATPLSCRRNYVVFFTDGAFNAVDADGAYHAIGNADGGNALDVSGNLPDGTYFDLTSDQTRIYRDHNNEATSRLTARTSPFHTYYSWIWTGYDHQRINYNTTLADIAFHFWATDLQPTMNNDVHPVIKVASKEKHENNGITVELEPYWNPKNDPATWQHINFFTIGYNAASDWMHILPALVNTAPPQYGSSTSPSYITQDNWFPGATRAPDFDWGNVTTGTWSGNDYSALVTGNLTWPDPLKTYLKGDPSAANVDTYLSECSYRSDYSTYIYNYDRCEAAYPKATDLWHAAINSRGRFVPVKKDESLHEAFKSILSGLELGGGIRNSSTAPTGTSSSAFSTDSKIFTAEFDPDGWQGNVTMYKLAYSYSTSTTGTATATASLSEDWSAGSELTDKLSTTSGLNDRFVMMKGFASDDTTVEGKLFKLNTGSPCDLDAVFTNFSEAHRNGIFNDDTTANPPSGIICQEVVDKINYIRGDRSNEIENGGLLRNRKSSSGTVNLLGDIVNSNIWFTPAKPASDYYLHEYHTWRNSAISNRSPMIYVGANDGMLHGFDADTGEEKIAYIPSAFLIRANGTGAATLMVTPNDNYVHRYYADGPVFTADVDLERNPNPAFSGKWKTYLAGALGAGGKGYYILDVTDPEKFRPSNVGDLLIADTSDGMAMAAAYAPDHADYIGHIFGEPVREQGNTAISRQITRINYSPSDDDIWAFITNNGYNSENETPALFVHLLNGSGTDENRIIRLDVDCGGNPSCLSTVSTSNGLSTPRLIDLNGDNVPDVAYAGDLQGNVWRFDISSTTDWASIKGERLFTAMDSGNNRQPVTSAPVWMAHPNGGIMLAFGTGRLLTSDDRKDDQTQTIYGIYDNTVSRGNSVKGGAIIGPLTAVNKNDDLVQQKISDSVVGTTSDGGDNLWGVTSEAVKYTGVDAKRGWYLDLPEDSRERVIENPEWFDGKLIHIYSRIPAIQTGSSTNPTPAVESCESVSVQGSKTYRTTLNIINGNAPVSQIFNYTANSGDDNAARIEYQRGFLVNDGKYQYNICPGGDCSAATTSTSVTNRLQRIAVEPSWIQVR